MLNIFIHSSIIMKYSTLFLTLLTSSTILTACNNQDSGSSSSTTSTPSSNTSSYFQTKQPYQPQQDISSYQAIPNGFSPVFTELVARHGSRGLSSMKYDLALYNLWLKAKEENALTPLGEQLGPDLEAMMKANILLGYGVEGIRQYGYGNESAMGIQEHQGIAKRLLQRMPSLFTQAVQEGKSIQVLSSGVDRAVDSAKFFTHALIQQQPTLSPYITPMSYSSLNSSSTPSIADGGVNRFLLYFHSLTSQDDLALVATEIQQQVYDASLTYQDYEINNADLLQKLNQLNADSKINQVALEVLTPLFTAEFIQKIGQSNYIFANSGSYSVIAPNGETVTEKGKGKNSIRSVVDAAAYLYELYSINGGLKEELGQTNFSKYMPTDAAAFYAEYADANDFYTKGPSFDAGKAYTTNIAQGLKQDLFKQIDAVINHTQNDIAVLRFTHAEIMIPLATSLELNNVMQSLPLNTTYSYSNSAWRGETISPMAANLQWDVYQDKQGLTLVKMLYNEKETYFKADCNYARYQSNSYYYDYLKLKQCYNIQ